MGYVSLDNLMYGGQQTLPNTDSYSVPVYQNHTVDDDDVQFLVSSPGGLDTTHHHPSNGFYGNGMSTTDIYGNSTPPYPSGSYGSMYTPHSDDAGHSIGAEYGAAELGDDSFRQWQDDTTDPVITTPKTHGVEEFEPLPSETVSGTTYDVKNMSWLQSLGALIAVILVIAASMIFAQSLLSGAGRTLRRRMKWWEMLCLSGAVLLLAMVISYASVPQV